MDNAKQDTGKSPSPPYVAFSTTRTLFNTLKEHGVPGRIDRSVLGNFSGQVGGQLITALRFLALIDADNHPTPALAQIVNACGTDTWPRALHGLLSQAYAPLMESNLATATPAQFNDRFKELYPAEGDTLRKCMTFFLSAAKEAGIEISPYIMKNKKPRAAMRRKTPKAKPAADAPKVEEASLNINKLADIAVQPLLQTAEHILVALLDPAMEKDEQQAIFTLLLYLKKPKKNGGAS